MLNPVIRHMPNLFSGAKVFNYILIANKLEINFSGKFSKQNSLYFPDNNSLNLGVSENNSRAALTSLSLFNAYRVWPS